MILLGATHDGGRNDPTPRSAGWIPSRARAALTSTIVLIGVYVVLDILAQLLPPHYNPISQAESDLAVGPYGYIMSINFVVRGLLSIGFLLGLTTATGIGSRSRMGIALLGIWGVGAVLLAVFPTDIGTTESTRHGELHLLIALIAFVAATVGVVLLSRHFREEERLRAFATPAHILAVLTLLSFVAFAFATPVPFLLQHAYGLLERIFIGSVLLWMLAVSIFLVRSDRARDPVGPVASPDPG